MTAKSLGVDMRSVTFNQPLWLKAMEIGLYSSVFKGVRLFSNLANYEALRKVQLTVTD
jgi:hypothetical protein